MKRFRVHRLPRNLARASLAAARIAGTLLLVVAGMIPARGQPGSKEWCAMVNRGCIVPGPGQDRYKLCGIGQCRSPCPGERCKREFNVAQKMHCENLGIIGSTSADEKAKDLARRADQALKQVWDKYNGAAKCQLGGDIDCFYIFLDGLSDQCPAPPPSASSAPSTCQQDIKDMHDQHCQNVSNWWMAHCNGDAKEAQSIFDQDLKLKGDYSKLMQTPECKDSTLPPALDDQCFPPPEVCGAGTSRSNFSQGGGDGPPRGGGDGGGGGSGSSSGGQPPNPPRPQGPVHGTLVWLRIFPLNLPQHPPQGKAQPPIPPYPKGLGPVPILELRAWQELAASRDRAHHPVPAPDYAASVPDETPVDRAALKEMVPADDADEMSRAGIEAVNAVWEEVGWLDAFAVDYSRYLGAKAAGDQKAMLPLAEWMATLMDRALAAGRDAAAKQDRFERQVENKLDMIRAGVEAGGNSWPVVFKQARDAIKKHGLPPEVRQELTQAGISDGESKALLKQLAAVTPEGVQADVAALKSQNGAAGPQPLYLADLLAAQKLAYAARDEARAADKAVKEAAAKAVSASQPGSTSQTHTSWRSLILWATIALLAAVVILAFVNGVRSSKRAA